MIRGTIMAVDGGVLELGQWAIVTINRGARDGLQVGHVLASYRRGVVVDRVQGDAWEMPRWLARLNMKPNPVVPEPPQTYVVDGKTLVRSTGPIRLPDERNGLVFIFRVFDKLSYGMVMKASRPIFVGDLVQTP
jgi:hypothetical protein